MIEPYINFVLSFSDFDIVNTFNLPYGKPFAVCVVRSAESGSALSSGDLLYELVCPVEPYR